MTVSVVSINGATLATPQQTTLTLVDPNYPLISIEDQTAVESNSPNALVFVRLNTPVLTTVTVDYSTSLGTATPNVDYTPESSFITFSPGQTVQAISIPILDDSTPHEPPRTSL